MVGQNVGQRIGIIVKGYPRLSETFIAQEILALERRGLSLHIISLRQPYDALNHPTHRAIAAPVTYLPEYLHAQVWRVIRAWWRARRRRGYGRALRAWLADLKREPTRNRVRRFGQALVLTEELADSLTHLHVHFLHTPASVARYCSLMTGVPWSCSAHAKDIWTSSAWDIETKLRECAWLVTCTRHNLERLRAMSSRPQTLGLVYHGIDFQRFPEPESTGSSNVGRSSNVPVRLLSVGRAVQKKGYDDLLTALAQLPEALHWCFEHIGGGELCAELQEQAERLGLASRVRWHGPQPQPAVLDAYRAADIFVLACRIGDDGDRDGLPNVLVEAQSQKLPCIATRVSGIPELIEHGVTGILVAPRDASAMCAQIEALINDPVWRVRLGRAGFDRVRERFGMQHGIEQLAARFADRQSAGEYEDDLRARRVVAR